MIAGTVRVALVDFGGTGTQAEDRVRVAAALTKQASYHFALPPPHGWGLGAYVRAATGIYDVRPDEWVLALVKHPDQPGALGYHDLTPHGRPYAKIFPLLDEQDGSPWSVTASHELLEMLGDALCSVCVFGPDGKLWALEVCDACEALSYEIDGVKVSDFVTPPYFEPVRILDALKLDWMSQVRKPLEILPGGYGQWFDPQTGWQQVTHAQQPPRAYRLSAMHGAEPVVSAFARMALRGRGARRQGAFLVSRVPPAPTTEAA